MTGMPRGSAGGEQGERRGSVMAVILATVTLEPKAIGSTNVEIYNKGKHMNNEQQKKPYTAPTVVVVELPNQTDLLICSKNADGLCELGLADSTKEFFA